MAKKNAAQAQPKSAELKRALGAIRKHNNVRVGFSAYKMRVSPTEIRKVFPDLLKLSAYKQLAWPEPSPRTYHRIINQGLLYAADFLVEAEIFVQLMLPHAEALCAFIIFKEAFDDALLKGDFAKCDGILEEIKSKFGLSIWWIEAKVNVLHLKDGFAAQKEFSNTLIDTPEMPPMVRLLVGWFSFRSGQNITAAEFERLVTSTIPQDDIYQLIRIILGVCPNIEEARFGYVLSQTDVFSSIIDRYFYGIGTLQAYLACTKGVSETRKLVAPIRLLARAVIDGKLDAILIASGDDKLVQTKTYQLSAAENHLECGRYGDAITSASEVLSQNFSIEALSIALTAGNISGQPFEFQPAASSPLARIVSDLSSVLAYAPSAGGAYSRLEKIVLTYPSCGWASALNLILLRQGRDEKLVDPTRSQVFETLRATTKSTSKCFALEKLDAGLEYLRFIFAEDVNSLNFKINQSLLTPAIVCDFSELPKLHRVRLKAIGYLREDDPGGAEACLHPVYKQTLSQYWKCEIGLLLAEALLQKRDLKACAQVCADVYIASEYMGSMLPIEELVDAIVKQDEMAPRSELFLGSLPIVIVFDIYSRFFSAERNAERADAFRDFLAIQKVVHASDLIAEVSKFPKDQLIYFLRHVCVPEVLDQSLALQTTRAVEDERVKLLVQLNELVSAAEVATITALREELQDIRTRQVVRDTTLQLDQSKIYVDVEGIKKSLGNQLRENWQLFKLLSAQRGTTDGVEDVYDALRRAVGDRVALISLGLPPSERNKLFRRLIGDIREAFTTSKLFGLDPNLSTNIRHGFILRELRRPFVAAHLVTNRPKKAEPYQENQYWLDRIYGEGNHGESVSVALTTLSEKVDAEIETLIGSTLRILSDQTPNGLFDFRLNELELQLLENQADRITEYDKFLDYVFQFLWDRTDTHLLSVRNHLMTQTLSNLNNALMTLQEAVEKDCRWYPIEGLITAINLVRPDVRSAVERVATWFTISESRDYKDFPIKVAFDASIATVSSYYSHLQFKPDIRVADMPTMQGWTLPYFTRLFTIIFENAAEHSGISEDDLLLSISTKIVQQQLEIRIANQLSPNSDFVELSRTVARLNAEFGRDAASDFVRQEGSSGYPKMWKILTHDLRRTHDLGTALADGQFVIEMIMTIDGITA